MIHQRPPAWGLARPRSIWLPTWRGWLLLLVLGAALGFGFLRGAYFFLAVDDPRPGGVLVVEGWGGDDMMGATLREFQSRPYEGVYVTGGPIEKGSPLAEYGSCAEYGAVVLRRMGLDPARLQAVPSEEVVKDRTYASARALRAWLREHQRPVTKVNLVSSGPHARRSRLLFQKAFGDSVEVGIIPVQDPLFDPRRWWVTSSGFRTVVSEWIAYLYARFLFRPPSE